MGLCGSQYVLSLGPNEDLVLRCRGLAMVCSASDALTEGTPLEGFWRDRSLEYEANRRGKELDPETFIERLHSGARSPAVLATSIEGGNPAAHH